MSAEIKLVCLFVQVKGPNNPLAGLWWFPMFRYMESNVQGTVPRHYEWPLPFPRRWSAKVLQRTS